MGRLQGRMQRWLHSRRNVWLKVHLNFHGTALVALVETRSRLRGCDLGTRVSCYPARLSSLLFLSMKKVVQGDDMAC